MLRGGGRRGLHPELASLLSFFFFLGGGGREERTASWTGQSFLGVEGGEDCILDWPVIFGGGGRRGLHPGLASQCWGGGGRRGLHPGLASHFYFILFIYFGGGGGEKERTASWTGQSVLGGGGEERTASCTGQSVWGSEEKARAQAEEERGDWLVMECPLGAPFLVLAHPKAAHHGG